MLPNTSKQTSNAILYELSCVGEFPKMKSTTNLIHTYSIFHASGSLLSANVEFNLLDLLTS